MEYRKTFAVRYKICSSNVVCMEEDITSSVVSVYDSIALEYSKDYSVKSDSMFLQRFLSHLPPHARILDAGCGSGRFACFFHDKGFRVVGIDLSRKMLHIARKKLPKIKFIKMDMRKIKFKPGTFDAVIAPYSLFHLRRKDVPKAITGFARVLKPNGILMLIVQYGNKEGLVKDPRIPSIKIFVNLMNRRALKNLLRNAGFRLLHTIERKPKKNEFPFKKLCVIAERKANFKV